ncbi:IclR family transcriptional regulator [Lignipirellula cremea]|uniref:Transcriptional regulator KdgR n=1 Tax=Lignipirellula cremea TaxID=2528010 RepID=A0A518DLR9_9BACT|nr:IclR family transcriptional regulator [Lignipirellula cremea]QDU92788.1 Transcriptional regulator KdgR [Lignipirellula cremea]
MPEVKKSTVPNLQRGMAILEYLAGGQRCATIAELSERLGYPSASVFRITQELTELGYLSRDAASRRFSLTNKFLLLGQPQGDDRGLVEAALPALRGLRKATGETTQLCCLVETENVVLEQLLSIHPFKYSAELGARCPAYSCAPGKAILANLPADEREERLTRLRFKRFTATTITDRKAFRQELEEIVAVGYALDRGEGLEGIHCVAAAIRDRNGFPVGALTIAGPSSRIPPSEFPQLGQILATAASDAEARYGV